MDTDDTLISRLEAAAPRGGVCTRFAPSPTGYMHVGGMRTALFAYLYAKRHGGAFLLRVEDTDRERFVEGASEVICRTLRDAGLLYDEGPDIGGPVGPYVQSKREEIYAAYARRLIDRGGAYCCFCSKERLEKLRETNEALRLPNKYDGHCLNLSYEDAAAKMAAGEQYVVRQKMPREGETKFTDMVFGEIAMENSALDDQVLMKADGMPTYNFAHVVDDHLMGITHVIRGSEFLTSTPKYNLLYNAFGWEVPAYIHVAPVMRDSTHKLSKRAGDPSYEDLLAAGYLREAVINYVALLGWSPRSEREIYSLHELEQVFDISGLSKAPAVFDAKKLDWLNGEYIRALPREDFRALAMPYIRQSVRSEADTAAIARLLQKRCERLSDIPGQVDFIDAVGEYDTALYTHKKMKTDVNNARDTLSTVVNELSVLEHWNEETVKNTLETQAAERGLKNGQIMYPMRVALSGKATTPGGAVELACLFGREETLRRIKAAIALLSE
jgi:glutamyl-tRNA synthetase